MSLAAAPSRRARRAVPCLLALAAAVCGAAATPAAATTTLWSTTGPSSGAIIGLGEDGGRPQFLLNGRIGNPQSLAADADHVFWHDSGSSTITRADRDGGDLRQSFISGLGYLQDIAVDDRYVWWTTQGTDTVGRANLDGTDVRPSFAAVQSPRSIASDGTTVLVSTSSRGLSSVDPGDGTVRTNLVNGVTGDVAIAGDAVYWAASGGVGRSDLDGGHATNRFLATDASPDRIAADADRLYLDLLGRIDRVSRHGGEATTIAVPGVQIQGLATGPDRPGVATADAEAVGFGAAPVGALSATRAVRVSNTGDGPLRLRTASTTGADRDDFLLTGDGCSGTTLAPQATCTLGLRFAAAGAGDRRAELVVTATDGTTAVRVPLTGTGTGAPATATAPVSAAAPPATTATPAAVRHVRLRCSRAGGRARLRCTQREVAAAPAGTTGAKLLDGRDTVARGSVVRSAKRGPRMGVRVTVDMTGALAAGRYVLRVRVGGRTVRLPVTVTAA